MASGVEIRGVAEVSANLSRIAASTPRQIGKALYAEGLGVQADSMENTPVDTGALRASHETSRPEIAGDEVTVAVRCGGPAAGYAIQVHEDLEAHHDVGGAKFLENATNRAAPGLAERVAARLELGK